MLLHTAGPWIVSPPTPWTIDVPRERASTWWYVRTKLPEGGGTALAGVSGLTPEETEANARLMAAAPDLLAALREAAFEIDLAREHWGADSRTYRDLTRTFESLESAIDKATATPQEST